MKEQVTFEGYDKYFYVKPSQVADLLRQTKYKEVLERVERGELSFQFCRLWLNDSGDPYDWDSDMYLMEKGDSVESFFNTIAKATDDVWPDYCDLGYGSFCWGLIDSVEECIGEVRYHGEEGGVPVLRIKLKDL